MIKRALLLERLALFFYFAILDEKRAQHAALKTFRKIRTRAITQRRDTFDISNEEFVSLTFEVVSHLPANFRPVSLSSSSAYIILPEQSNWGPWFELKKDLDRNEFLVLVYSKILQFTEEEIAKGLNLTIGTIRYRLGHGLKMLGNICERGMVTHA